MPRVRAALRRLQENQTVRDAQIIVLENEAPPRDVECSAHLVRFTGTAHGEDTAPPAGPRLLRLHGPRVR